MKISIVGCGWLGLSLGEYLCLKGYLVNGSTTTPEKLSDLRRKGIIPHLLQVGQELKGSYEGLFQCDTLIINIPPGKNNPNIVKYHPAQVRLLVDKAKARRVRHIIFISSTGVYQNTRAVIDEEGPCTPTRSSAQALLRAESIVRASGIKWTIIRLAGLIGGKRQAGNWFAGKTDIPFGDTPVNMIHRDDCIVAIEKLVESGPSNEIYNLCANEHPLRKDFYHAQTKKLGGILPEFEEGTGPHKIVDNSKFKKKFDFHYKYPDPMTF